MSDQSRLPAQRYDERPVIVTMQVTQTIEVTPKWLADIFCGMNDEQQAQFFVECAAVAAGWEKPWGGPGYQWYLVGKHLRTCECSNESARNMVREIISGIEPPSQQEHSQPETQK